MIRINLLPKNELPRRKSIQLPHVGSFAPLALVAVVVVVIASAHFYQAQKIDALKTTIAEEEAETRRLAPEIAKIKRLNQQRKDLNDRLDVITRLDSDRYFRVHLLDELNRSLPGHMWLTRFEDVGADQYAVEGVTFSNFLVSDFLQDFHTGIVPNQSGFIDVSGIKMSLWFIRRAHFKRQHLRWQPHGIAVFDRLCF